MKEKKKEKTNLFDYEAGWRAPVILEDKRAVRLPSKFDVQSIHKLFKYFRKK
jgi:hypothetical protein